MRLEMLRCVYCGTMERKVYLHHGKLYCAMCLAPADGDDMCVRVKISILRAEEARSESRRLRKK